MSGNDALKEAVNETPHRSVMLEEVMAALNPSDGGIYVDGTFGAGGYSRAVLAAADCRVIAIDRDPTVHRFAEALAAKHPGRFALLIGRFSQMKPLLEAEGVRQVDGIVLDIGVSSMQLDQAERGFSFMQDGPLDMRMSDQGATAADLLATADEKELADILYYYGEERASRRLAKAILAAREKEPITTTAALKEIITDVLGAPRGDRIHPATRSFQALRIAVNDELRELEEALEAAEELLSPGGRLVVVSFHSLEDRIVKRFLRHKSEGREEGEASFRLESVRAVKAGEEEIRVNPRARSARLRAAIRLRKERLH